MREAAKVAAELQLTEPPGEALIEPMGHSHDDD
jgi:hypothetical protein